MQTAPLVQTQTSPRETWRSVQRQPAPLLPSLHLSTADCAALLLRFGSCFSTVNSSSRERKSQSVRSINCCWEWSQRPTGRRNGATETSLLVRLKLFTGSSSSLWHAWVLSQWCFVRKDLLRWCASCECKRTVHSSDSNATAKLALSNPESMTGHGQSGCRTLEKKNYININVIIHPKNMFFL